MLLLRQAAAREAEAEDVPGDMDAEYSRKRKDLCRDGSMSGGGEVRAAACTPCMRCVAAKAACRLLESLSRLLLLPPPPRMHARSATTTLLRARSRAWCGVWKCTSSLCRPSTSWA